MNKDLKIVETANLKVWTWHKLGLPQAEKEHEGSFSAVASVGRNAPRKVTAEMATGLNARNNSLLFVHICLIKGQGDKSTIRIIY